MRVGPILFSGPMVCALLEGRKTQTRRLLKPQPQFVTGRGRRIYADEDWKKSWEDGADDDLPYAPGDLLYVRETWQTGVSGDGPQISYRATPDFCAIDAWDGPDEGIGPSFNYERCPGAHFYHWLSDVLSDDGPWRPAIHMPRWASRLTLEVTGVKVEQIQDITEEDAIAEGVCAFVEANDNSSWRGLSADDRYGLVCATYGSARNAFHCLWDSLNAKRAPWDSNPWVVALTFTVIKQNVDALLASRTSSEAVGQTSRPQAGQRPVGPRT